MEQILKNQKQRELFNQIIKSDKPEEYLESLFRQDYERVPVDPRTFVKDKYYLGASIEELHDNWIHELEIVFDKDKPISEWLLGGSVGAGKTTVCSVALVYSRLS